MVDQTPSKVLGECTALWEEEGGREDKQDTHTSTIAHSNFLRPSLKLSSMTHTYLHICKQKMQHHLTSVGLLLLLSKCNWL